MRLGPFLYSACRQSSKREARRQNLKIFLSCKAWGWRYVAPLQGFHDYLDSVCSFIFSAAGRFTALSALCSSSYVASKICVKQVRYNNSHPFIGMLVVKLLTVKSGDDRGEQMRMLSTADALCCATG